MTECPRCHTDADVRMLKIYGYYALYVCDDCGLEFYEEY